MFNDMTDFDIDTSPADIWEKLQIFNEDFYNGNFKLEQNVEKKNFVLEAADSNIKVKVKFLELKQSNDEPTRLRVRFTKKKGDISAWYDLFNEMKETVFEGVLLAPRVHH